MKKIVAVLATAFAVLLCVLSVNADGFDMCAKSEQAYVGRVFDVNLTTDMLDNISGGLVTVKYDSDVAEFKGASGECFTVRTKESEGEVKLAFVTSGVIKGDNLLTLKFKGKNEGSFDIEVLCDGFVDRELNRAEVFCSGCKVNVESKATARKSVEGTCNECVTKTDSQIYDNNYVVVTDEANKNNRVFYISAFVLFVLLVIYSVLILTDSLKLFRKNKSGR